MLKNLMSSLKELTGRVRPHLFRFWKSLLAWVVYWRILAIATLEKFLIPAAKAILTRVYKRGNLLMPIIRSWSLRLGVYLAISLAAGLVSKTVWSVLVSMETVEAILWCVVPILLFILYYLVRLAIYEDGKRDHIFTFINEGELKVVERLGRPIKAFLRLEGFALGLPTEDNLPDSVKEILFWKTKGKKKTLPNRHRLILDDGFDHWTIIKSESKPVWSRWVLRHVRNIFPYDTVKFVGFLPGTKVRTYEFTRLAYKPNEKEGEGAPFVRFVHKANPKGTEHPPLTSIFVRPYQYGAFLSGVELRGGFYYNIWFVDTYRVVNPVRALYRRHHWLDAANADTNPQRLALLGQVNQQELQARQYENEKRKTVKIDEALLKICRGFNLLGWTYGVCLVSSRIERFELTDEGLRKASTVIERTRLEALAAENVARGATALIRQVRKDADGMTPEQQAALVTLQLTRIPGLNLNLVAPSSTGVGMLFSSPGTPTPGTKVSETPTPT